MAHRLQTDTIDSDFNDREESSMAYLRAVTNAPHTRAALYKADYPRRIDQHIDFFGDAGARPEVADDGCGDFLLGLLA